MNTKIITVFMLLTFLSGSAAQAFPFFGNNNRGYNCHHHHHHHPAFARGGLLAANGMARAIALANTSAEAAHIRMHLDRLMRDSQPRGAKAGK